MAKVRDVSPFAIDGSRLDPDNPPQPARRLTPREARIVARFEAAPHAFGRPEPRRREAVLRAARRLRGISMREWMEQRSIDNAKARAKARAERVVPERGVDRVPERLRVERPEPVVLVRPGYTLDYGGMRAEVRRAARAARKERRRSDA